jgi:hypothetical protein
VCLDEASSGGAAGSTTEFAVDMPLSRCRNDNRITRMCKCARVTKKVKLRDVRLPALCRGSSGPISRLAALLRTQSDVHRTKSAVLRNASPCLMMSISTPKYDVPRHSDGKNTTR